MKLDSSGSEKEILTTLRAIHLKPQSLLLKEGFYLIIVLSSQEVIWKIKI